jgi:hypothetical protein
MDLVVNPGANTAWAAGNWGQSFTATDGDIGSVGLLLWNYGAPANVTLNVYGGDGTGGSLLRSQVLTVPTSSNGDWVDVDVSDLVFSGNSKYTIGMTDGGNVDAKFCETNSYAFGGAYYGSSPVSNYDLSFRVVASVPEPSSVALLGLGILGFCRRRR